MEEFGLKQMWRSPNGTIRNILNGAPWPTLWQCCVCNPGATASACALHRLNAWTAPDTRNTRLQAPCSESPSSCQTCRAWCLVGSTPSSLAGALLAQRAALWRLGTLNKACMKLCRHAMSHRS